MTTASASQVSAVMSTASSTATAMHAEARFSSAGAENGSTRRNYIALNFNLNPIHFEIYNLFVNALDPNDYRDFIASWKGSVKVLKSASAVASSTNPAVVKFKITDYTNEFKYYSYILSQYRVGVDGVVELKDSIQNPKIKLTNITASKLVKVVADTFIKDAIEGCEEIVEGLHQKIDDSDFICILHREKTSTQMVILHWMTRKILGKGGDGRVDEMLDIVTGQIYAIKYPNFDRSKFQTTKIKISQEAKRISEMEDKLAIQLIKDKEIQSNELQSASEQLAIDKKRLAAGQESLNFEHNRELQRLSQRFSFETNALIHLEKYPNVKEFVVNAQFIVKVPPFYFYAAPVFSMNLYEYIQRPHTAIKRLLICQKLIHALFNIHYLREEQNKVQVVVDGTAHRDISVDNFLVMIENDNQEQIVLTDFARSTFRKMPNPRSADYKAHPGYYRLTDQHVFAITEQLIARKAVTPEQAFENYQKLDVFALAVVLCKVVAHHKFWPFGSEEITKQSAAPDLKEIESAKYPVQCTAILSTMLSDTLLQRPSIDKVKTAWDKMVKAIELNSQQFFGEQLISTASLVPQVSKMTDETAKEAVAVDYLPTSATVTTALK
jgi:serine/threonine protein kinase